MDCLAHVLRKVFCILVKFRLRVVIGIYCLTFVVNGLMGDRPATLLYGWTL